MAHYVPKPLAEGSDAAPDDWGSGARVGAKQPAGEPAKPQDLVPPELEERVRAVVECQDFAFRALRRRGLSQADADEGALHVITGMLEQIEKVQPGKQRAYAYTAARLYSLNHRRSVSRRGDQLALGAEIELSDDEASSPETLLDRKRTLELFQQVLAELSGDLREAFALFEVEGWTTVEISEALAVPLGTVASRLRRAREKFESICLLKERSR